MRDYANPVLLLVVIVLLSVKVSFGLETPSSVEVWLMTLCTTGLVVNALLCTARLLAKRKPIMPFVWSSVYLILVSCSWVILRQEKDYTQEIQSYQVLRGQWERDKANPFTLRDEEGHTLMELATILGKTMVIRNMIALPEAAHASEVIMRSAIAAAENGRHEILTILAKDAAVDLNQLTNGSTPLIAAVLSNNLKSAKALLELKAAPDRCDEQGMTPLMHAVINENPGMVRLLMQHGANPHLKDKSGRDAASRSRSEAIDALLSAPASMTD